MRYILMMLGTLAAGPASAHVGHLGGFGGHDHWVAGAAIGLAAGIALWGKLKGAKDKQADTETEAQADGQEECA